MRGGFAALMLLGLCNGARAAEPCSKVEIAGQAQAVEQARALLAARPQGGKFNPDVSPETFQAITGLRNRLADLIDQSLGCAAPDVTAKNLEHDIAALLPGPAPNGPAPLADESWGSLVGVTIRRSPENPGVIGVLARFSVKCGRDGMLLLFTPRADRGWQEVLRWQSRPYKTVDGAFSALDFAVSPPDASGNWFVATKHVLPVCSGAWSSIQYNILRPQPGRIEPRKIFGGTDSIWWGGGDYGLLTASRDEIDLRFHAESLDTSVPPRLQVRHFAVGLDGAKRTAPLAVAPGDFVEEWLQLPWTEAAAVTGAGADLGTLHDLLRKIYQKTLFFQYKSVRACTGEPERVEVGIGFDVDYGNYIFGVSTKGEYRLLSAAKKPDPRCTGPNLLGR